MKIPWTPYYIGRWRLAKPRDMVERCMTNISHTEDELASIRPMLLSLSAYAATDKRYAQELDQKLNKAIELLSEQGELLSIVCREQPWFMKNAVCKKCGHKHLVPIATALKHVSCRNCNGKLALEK